MYDLYCVQVVERIGYIDEAYDESIYVLACVIGAPARGKAQFAGLRTLLLRNQRELHFNRESHKRRILLAEEYARLNARAIVAMKESPGSSERRRGLCLVALTWAIDNYVDHLIFDARQSQGNAHDSAVLTGVASHGPDLSAEFRRSEDQEGLWAADIVAGAIFASFARAKPEYKLALDASVKIIPA